jgi:hypothetical protein
MNNGYIIGYSSQKDFSELFMVEGKSKLTKELGPGREKEGVAKIIVLLKGDYEEEKKSPQKSSEKNGAKVLVGDLVFLYDDGK